MDMESLKEMAQKVIDNKWEKDAQKDLSKYNEEELYRYVRVACSNSNYIEAYTLVTQYVTEILVLPFSRAEKKQAFINQTNGKLLIEQYHELGLASDQFRQQYLRTKEIRNDLAHNMLFRAAIRETLSKENPKTHSLRLQRLMIEAENFIIDYAEKNQKTFIALEHDKTGKIVIRNKDHRYRFNIFLKIMINKAIRETQNSLENETYNESYSVKFHTLLKEIYNNDLKRTLGFQLSN